MQLELDADEIPAHLLQYFEPVQRPELRSKNLASIPWRVALALQADGWYLRSDIIWAKPNPMPESVTDRPTKAHEYVFLFSKSQRYCFDGDAVREKHVDFERGNNPPEMRGHSGKSGGIISGTREAMKGVDSNGAKRVYNPSGRNIRTVWQIATQSYRGAHFATWPEKLVEPMIKAGSSEKGCCPKCGKQWVRVVEKDGKFQRRWSTNNAEGSPYNRQDSFQNTYKFIGWRPACDCYDEQYRTDFPRARSARKRYQQWAAGYWWKRVRKMPGLPHWKVEPCTVLDPFAGSGTTGKVAARLRRGFVGLELNPAYIELARERISETQIEML